MLKIYRIKLIIIGILLGVILGSTGCHHMRQRSNFLEGIDESNRARRESILLALKPYEYDGSMHRNDEQFSLDTEGTSYQIPMKNKRELSKNSEPHVYLPEVKQYALLNVDFLNNQHETEVGQYPEIPVDNIGTRKDKRNVEASMPISFVPQVTRTIQHGKPMCYCQECKTSQCHHCNPPKLEKIPVKIVVDDNSEDDTSAEVYDPPINSGSESLNEPIKFNIPLINSKSSDSKSSGEKNSKNDGPFLSKPYIMRGSYSGMTQNQQKNALNVRTLTDIGNEPQISVSNKKCTGAVCEVTQSNTATSFIETTDPSDKASSRTQLDKGEVTTARILIEPYENKASVPLIYSPQYGYQTANPTAQRVYFNNGVYLNNLGIAANLDVQAQKFQGNKIYYRNAVPNYGVNSRLPYANQYYYHSVPSNSVGTGYANVNPQSDKDSKDPKSPKSDSDKLIEENEQNDFHTVKHSPVLNKNRDRDQKLKSRTNYQFLSQVISTSSEKPVTTVHESLLNSLNLNSDALRAVENDGSYKTVELTSNLKLSDPSETIENNSVLNYSPVNIMNADITYDNIKSQNLVGTAKVKKPRSADTGTFYYPPNIQNNQENEVFMKTLNNYYRANGNPEFIVGEKLMNVHPVHDMRVPQIYYGNFANENIQHRANTDPNSGINRNYEYYQYPLTAYGNTVESLKLPQLYATSYNNYMQNNLQSPMKPIQNNVNKAKVQNEKSEEFMQNPSHSIKDVRSGYVYAPAYQNLSPKSKHYSENMKNLNSFTNMNKPVPMPAYDTARTVLGDYKSQEEQVKESSFNDIGDYNYDPTLQHWNPYDRLPSQSSNLASQIQAQDNAQNVNGKNSAIDLLDILDANSQTQENLSKTADRQKISEQFLKLKNAPQIPTTEPKSIAPNNEQYNILQNAVKKVINNFVPGKAQDLIVNYETGKDLESFIRTIEDFQPEILGTPVLRSLLSVPEIEDMIVDTSSNFLSQITGKSANSGTPDLIRNMLHKVIEEIPSQPIVSPLVVDKRHSRDNQWVTERVTQLTSTSPSVDQTDPPTEVFDAIKSIISKSTLGEEAVAQPVAKNLIIKAAKHRLDKKIGAIDEFTIRQAFNLLVQPKAQMSPEVGAAPKSTPTSTVGYKKAPVITVKERVATPGGAWVDTTKTGFRSGSSWSEHKKKDFEEKLRKIDTEVSDDGTSIVTAVPLDYMAVGNPKRVDSNSAGAETSTNLNHSLQATNPTSTEQNRYSLLIEPTTDTTEPRTPREDENSMPNDAPYLGQLVPVNSVGGHEVSTSQLVWVGDGVRLPLTRRKLPNGSYALTLSDDLCRQFVNRKCPCCLSTKGNIVRERRSQGVDVEPAGGESAGQQGTARFRRDSTEVLRDVEPKLSRNIGGFLDDLGRVGKSFNHVIENPPNSANGLSDATDDYTTDKKSSKRATGRDSIYFTYGRNDIKQPDSSIIDSPYRYQRYANEDWFISTKTRALQNMLYWMKDIAIKASQNKT